MSTSNKSRNRERAANAAKALAVHVETIGGHDNELPIQVQDLLTDLLHLCGENGIDLDECTYHARIHYAAELSGED